MDRRAKKDARFGEGYFLKISLRLATLLAFFDSITYLYTIDYFVPGWPYKK